MKAAATPCHAPVTRRPWPFYVAAEPSIADKAESLSGGAAAVQARRMGKTAVIAEWSQHLGGLTTGGVNFDAKVRRESIDPEDLFHAHIGGMDAFARGLKIAAAVRADGRIGEFV